MKILNSFAAYVSAKSVSDSMAYHDKKLSDAEQGSLEYDQEALFGGNVDMLEELRALGLREVKRRLFKLCETNIDRNGDKFITEKEMSQWIRYQQVLYVHEETTRVWTEHDQTNDSLLSWDQYLEEAFGGVEDLNELDENGHSHNQNKQRDMRKWKVAQSLEDEEEPQPINMADFSAFLHPEHFPKMHDIYIQELMEDMDLSQDSKISLDEYLRELTKDLDESEDADWLDNEKSMFQTIRDKNNNGFMDFEEVKDWVLPDEIDHANQEAKRLLHLMDKHSNDKKYTCKNLSESPEIFIDSSCTDWGEWLLRHQEF